MQRRIRPISTNLIIILNALVGIRKSTHARHHSEDVVVHGIHAEVEGTALGRVGACLEAVKHERGRVNAGEVTRSGRLVLLRLESKRIHVDRVRRLVGLERSGQLSRGGDRIIIGKTGCCCSIT